MKLSNYAKKKIGLLILIFGIGLTSLESKAGPAIASGLEFKNVSREVCNQVSKDILSKIHTFDSIKDTSLGNVIAESGDLTVLVTCYSQAISISVAGYSRADANDLVSQFRALLNQRL